MQLTKSSKRFISVGLIAVCLSIALAPEPAHADWIQVSHLIL